MINYGTCDILVLPISSPTWDPGSTARAQPRLPLPKGVPVVTLVGVPGRQTEPVRVPLTRKMVARWI